MTKGAREGFANTIEDTMTGLPYGSGNGPADGSVDCSGTVIGGLRSEGYNVKDLTANGLSKSDYIKPIDPNNAQKGDLIFYNWDGDKTVDHVVPVTGTNNKGDLQGIQSSEQYKTTKSINLNTYFKNIITEDTVVTAGRVDFNKLKQQQKQ